MTPRAVTCSTIRSLAHPPPPLHTCVQSFYPTKWGPDSNKSYIESLQRFQWPRLSKWPMPAQDVGVGGIILRTVNLPEREVVASGGSWLLRALSAVVLEVPRVSGRPLPQAVLQVGSVCLSVAA
jgi:hypothetical protein